MCSTYHAARAGWGRRLLLGERSRRDEEGARGGGHDHQGYEQGPHRVLLLLLFGGASFWLLGMCDCVCGL